MENKEYVIEREYRNKILETQKTRMEFLENHFHYEVTMILDSLNFRNTTKFEERMVLETNLTHLRVLLEFFERKYQNNQRHPDTAYAQDFYNNWPDERKTNLSTNYEKVSSEISKRISHLTYRRGFVKPEEIPWDLQKESLPVLKTAVEFIDKIDTDNKENRSEKLGKLGSDINEKISGIITGKTIVKQTTASDMSAFTSPSLGITSLKST